MDSKKIRIYRRILKKVNYLFKETVFDYLIFYNLYINIRLYY